MFERFDFGFYTGVATLLLWDYLVKDNGINSLVVLGLVIALNMLMRLLSNIVNRGARESK